MDLDKEKQPDGGIRKIYVCGLCSRETRVVLPAPAPLSKHKRDAIRTGKALERATVPTKTTPMEDIATGTKTSLASTATPATNSANAGSKKRAKNRKAGLLALLDKKRESHGGLGSLNLSFDDFRKK